MFEKRRPKAPTRLIFVRHLDTQGRQVRDIIKKDDRYLDLMQFIDAGRLNRDELLLAGVLGTSLLKSYPMLPKDAELPILPGQEDLGRKIGRELIVRHGKPDRWEVSPYLRARQTSDLLRQGAQEGVPDNALPSEQVNALIHEKSFGASDEYSSSKIFLATHPDELLKYVRDRRAYAYPGGESKYSFRKRIKRNVRKLSWKKAYEGKTNVFVAHSVVIEEHGKQLLGRDVDRHDIGIGSVTVFEAAPKMFLRRRKFHLVGQIGERLV